MYLLQCPFYVKNYLRTHNRISLQGNPVTMQAEIDFLFSYFARFFFFWWGGGGGEPAARDFFRPRSDVASISFTLQLKCITQVTRIFRKV